MGRESVDPSLCTGRFGVKALTMEGKRPQEAGADRLKGGVIQGGGGAHGKLDWTAREAHVNFRIPVSTEQTSITLPIRLVSHTVI